VIDADGRPPVKCKTHIPGIRAFEKNSPPATAATCETKYAIFSVLICFDQWFPGGRPLVCASWRRVDFYPTAIGRLANYTDPDREWDWRDSWEQSNAYAIANGIHIAAVNRVGREGRMTFGAIHLSRIRLVAWWLSGKTELVIAKIDLAKMWIQDGWGFLRNRRPRRGLWCRR
jgi:agmatine deiminase